MLTFYVGDAMFLFNFCSIWYVSCSFIFAEPINFCLCKSDRKNIRIEIKGEIIANVWSKFSIVSVVCKVENTLYVCAKTLQNT